MYNVKYILSLILFGLVVYFCFFFCFFNKGYIFVTSNNLIINNNMTSNREFFTRLLDVIYE